MANRRKEAPGIDVNEIDRSRYDETVDNSTIGTATFALGFADKGEDYTVRWINTLNSYTRYYGTPKTEAEKYLYNTVYEVLQNNGVCYVAKLPYKNDSLSHYVYTSYNLPPSASYLSSNSALSDDMLSVDSSLKTYAEISSSEQGDGLMSYDDYDEYVTKQKKVPSNTLRIVDITRGQYESDTFGNEVFGIMPVVVTPVNALFYQEFIQQTNNKLSTYSVIAKFRNINRQNKTLSAEISTSVDATDTVVNIKGLDVERQFVGIGDYLGREVFNKGKPLSSEVTINDYTVSENAASHFPSLRYIDNRLERKYLNHIGIVVFKVVKNASNYNKLTFVPVESFIGSLDPWAKDESTNEGSFIDDVVNNNSDYINVFSNAKIQREKSPDILNMKNVDILAIKNQTGCSMGFYAADMVKTINIRTSIFDAMETIFSKYQDSNLLDFDILCDAGITNIAQFIASVYTNNSDQLSREGLYTFDDDVWKNFKLKSPDDIFVYKKILQRFDDFVKNVRKDALLLVDGPRPFCLEGNYKIVRKTKPENTVKDDIIPKMKFISGILNSSYSAGYVNWFYSLDHSTGEYMWMPPSIKALGVYYYTDIYGAYWDAPAGLNRGKIRDTLDIAFNPTNEEAGKIYINSWNYAINYPLDGIVLEGQKTFQTEKTAFDRVNVRRLMIGIEKQIKFFCKYFNYEGNTAFHRRQITDVLDNYLQQVKQNNGVNQYLVVCNDRNNTPETIDNNELHIAIGIQPIKTIEWIVVSFILTNQSTSVEEAIVAELGT